MNELKEENKIRLEINGKLRLVDGYLKEGKSYIRINNMDIPLRDVGNALGFQVSWNQETRTVIFKD